MRRALFIVITDLPGGAERVTFSLARMLAARPGWEVEVKIVCARSPCSFTRAMLPRNVKVRYGFLRNWHFAFPLFPLRLLFRRFDFVFSTQVYPNALVRILRRPRLFRSSRLVLRESTSPFDQFAGTKARKFRLLYRAYGSEDALIAQTNYMAERLKHSVPERSTSHVRVLANPVDAPLIALAASEPLEPGLHARFDGRLNILFCGRLIDAKRPLTALE